MQNSPDCIIILPHLKIQNVNIISSPLTWGFPAITNLLGFVHALERKISVQYPDLKLGGVGAICHHFRPQIYWPDKQRDALFCLTRNPLEKEGNTPALVEEGRANMEISLIIQAFGGDYLIGDDKKQHIATDIFNVAQTLRLAGGSFIPNDSMDMKASLIEWPPQYDVLEKETKKILRRLMPGFTLISREDLLIEQTDELQKNNTQAAALDTLLEYSSLNFEPGTPDEAGKTEWKIRQKPGWMVPIPVGYSAISELYEPGTVLNARDNTCPFQFVESIYSLGQWLSPHRIKDIEHIFWHYHTDAENGLYRCINNPQGSLPNFNLKEK